MVLTVIVLFTYLASDAAPHITRRVIPVTDGIDLITLAWIIFESANKE